MEIMSLSLIILGVSLLLIKNHQEEKVINKNPFPFYYQIILNSYNELINYFFNHLKEDHDQLFYIIRVNPKRILFIL